MALATGFKRGLLDGISLEKPVQLNLLAPAAAVIVKTDLAGTGVEHGWINPAGQSHQKPSGFGGKESDSARDGSIKPQSLAGKLDGDCIANFGFDLNNVAHAYRDPLVVEVSEFMSSSSDSMEPIQSVLASSFGRVFGTDKILGIVSS
jgi:hypothetical protein